MASTPSKAARAVPRSHGSSREVPELAAPPAPHAPGDPRSGPRASFLSGFPMGPLLGCSPTGEPSSWVSPLLGMLFPSLPLSFKSLLKGRLLLNPGFKLVTCSPSFTSKPSSCCFIFPKAHITDIPHMKHLLCLLLIVRLPCTRANIWSPCLSLMCPECLEECLYC